jgi:putative cell wall-binding protein
MRSWAPRRLRTVAAIALAALTASLFAFATPAGAAATTQRYGGADRYETAALAALDSYTSGANQNIVLASGENFPDGLAAATLSGAANAPLLLTARDSLPASTANAIGNLGGATPGLVTIHVVGGTSAISQNVRNQLTGLGYKLNEIGGANRYETAANVAAAARTIAGNGLFQGLRTAIVVTGENFPDALSAGALAHAFDVPVLLTASGSLSAEASAALDAGNIQQVFVVGGTSAVSAGVVSAIEAKGISVIRLSGANRFGTAAAVSNRLTAEVIAGGAGWDGDEFTLAYGLNFPDALAASQVASLNQAPILLTGSVPTDTCNVLTNNSPVSKLFVLGGTAVISADTLNAAVACAELDAPTAEITALDGRSSFTVKYSTQVINSTDTFNYLINNSTNPLAVSPGAPGSNEVTITLLNPLEPNDLITVNPAAQGPARVQTAQGALVPLTNFVVQADTTAPTVTLIKGFVDEPYVFVFFSEDVTNTAGVAAITVTGVDTHSITGWPFAGTARVWRVELVSNPQEGATVTVHAGAFIDRAATPNSNPAASALVTRDTTGPSVTSATYTTIPWTEAKITLDGDLLITARPEGVAAGHAGNAWTVTRVVASSIQVQVNTTLRQIQIGAPTGDVPVTDLVLALGNNPMFLANFRVEILGPGPLTIPAGPTNLSGGASYVKVTLQMNEQVAPNDHYGLLGGTDDRLDPADHLTGVTGGDVDGGGAPDPVSAAAALAAPFQGQKVMWYVTPDYGPLPTFLNLSANAILDLAGNGNNPQSLPVTAG